jgi:hypothetical protein
MGRPQHSFTPQPDHRARVERALARAAVLYPQRRLTWGFALTVVPEVELLRSMPDPTDEPELSTYFSVDTLGGERLPITADLLVRLAEVGVWLDGDVRVLVETDDPPLGVARLSTLVVTRERPGVPGIEWAPYLCATYGAHLAWEPIVFLAQRVPPGWPR